MSTTASVILTSLDVHKVEAVHVTRQHYDGPRAFDAVTLIIQHDEGTMAVHLYCAAGQDIGIGPAPKNEAPESPAEEASL